ncbi:helix-turn-helix transcriptional regulator [Spirochaeta isovalerica]|uniref:DNA-binding CsgD family transcriptional regulator n=1 Tax=Spirochaeta isovalerica TaxID=150 RepID=A0A841R9D7_9SPIO|nr:response regulator transcription factor [Spirochaeta isovalerica]MBB6479559.1 DNA-binding CsgD family transcriptional regulator [Spirochaeta isovalerica]
MVHFIFLVQVLTLILAFAVLAILIQNYLMHRNRTIIFFLIAVTLIMARTVIFALARYGDLSRFYIFSVRFSSHPRGGLVYCSLVYLSHLFLLMGMGRLSGKKVPFPFYLGIAFFAIFSILAYIQLLSGNPLFFIPYSLRNVTGVSVIPILSVKGIILLCCLLRVFRGEKDLLLNAFLLLQSFGQAADGLFYAFELLRPVTLVLSLVLPYTAYLFLLPSLLRRKWNNPEEGRVSLFPGEFADLYHLTDEEKEIAIAIGEGKSNKEIAFERNTTLSIIKHRIYQLYKKCGINSRWELLKLLKG